MSWCVSSGYFKNHWGLKLFLKCHRRSQNVYFFLLGTNHFIKHSGVFFRSSRLEVFCKKVVLGNSKNSEESTCARVSFLIKLQALDSQFYLKKSLWHRCFPVNFVKFLRTQSFIQHLRWLLLILTGDL